jgi:mono/diheme cytochrome c family protein
MKPWKSISLIVLLVVGVTSGFGLALIQRGFSARGTPSTAEKFVATTARRLAVPSNYRQLHNPLPTTPENLRAGMEHFADHCATCHGNDGSGNTMLGNGLYPKPPDMRTAETQGESDGKLYYTIENGVRLTGMPAFGKEHDLGDEDTWRLVLFIRHLPKTTTEELQQMKRLNPKTEEERREEKQEEEFLRGDDPKSQGTNHIRTKGEQ